jgi:transcriptional regulator with XRE-family HTH domain
MYSNNAKLLFGQHLASVRKQLGFSQEGLALEAGIARSYLSGVERGKRNISLVNICRLAETLKVSPASLLEFDTLM